jgi:hypothetical protein
MKHLQTRHYKEVRRGNRLLYTAAMLTCGCHAIARNDMVYKTT